MNQAKSSRPESSRAKQVKPCQSPTRAMPEPIKPSRSSQAKRAKPIAPQLLWGHCPCCSGTGAQVKLELSGCQSSPSLQRRNCPSCAGIVRLPFVFMAPSTQVLPALSGCLLLTPLLWNHPPCSAGVVWSPYIALRHHPACTPCRNQLLQLLHSFLPAPRPPPRE